MIGEKPRLKLTYADYLAAPEDKRYELLDGELLEIPSLGETHQSTQAEPSYTTMTCVKTRDLGRVYFLPTDAVLSDVDVEQP